MTPGFRGQHRQRFGRAAAAQSQSTAIGLRARRKGRWTGHRPLSEEVNQARLRTIADQEERQ